MIDHAKHINALRASESEDARIAEMERRSSPFLWLLIVAVVAAVVAFAAHYADLRSERTALSDAIVHLANGGTASVGDDGVMVCTVRPVMGDGL